MNRQTPRAGWHTAFGKIAALAARGKHKLRAAQQRLRHIISASSSPEQRVQTVYRVIYTERVQLPPVRFETSAGYAETYEEHAHPLGAVRITVTQEAFQSEHLDLPVLGMWFTRKRMMRRTTRHNHQIARPDSSSNEEKPEG